MPTVRKLMVPLALIVLLLVAAPSASAASGGTTTREIVRETVTWTLPEDQCGDLPAGVAVKGTGERRMEIVTKTRADGSTRVTVDDVVNGTATYSNNPGVPYPFHYRNHTTEDRPASGDIQVHMTDRFVLDGAGRARLISAFNWHWVYDPAKDETQWPPSRNVREHSTHGDPFNCDPI